MSVLIKGMEMPECCGKCALCVNGFTDDAPMYECAASGDDMTSVLVDDHGKPFDFRPDWCPLVEVKEPHGRLIDIKSVEDGKFVNADNEYQKWWNGALESVINYAETIIEAEGSET